MREYELIIENAFRNGLTPFEHIPFNQQLLTECLGFRVGKIGLELYEQKENPLPAALDISYNWPFPQVISGEGYRFLIIRRDDRDSCYIIGDEPRTASSSRSPISSSTASSPAARRRSRFQG